MLTLQSKGNTADRVVAIKALRELTKCSLKDARDAIVMTQEHDVPVQVELDVIDNSQEYRDAILTLEGQGIIVHSDLMSLVGTLESALKISIEARKYLASSKIIDTLIELGVSR